jgi:hypothetical protein
MGQKIENKPSEHKNGIWVPKSVGSCDISIDREFYTGVGEKKPSEPKNGIWGPKSVWSCDMSIDREFYIDEEIIYF